MEKRWVKRKVDLGLLSESLAAFFAEKGFRSRVERQARVYEISALPRFAHGILEKVTVVITGDPDNFAVSFVSGKQSHSFVRYGSLTTIFGGGGFLLRGLKSEEMLEKLENDFWIQLELMIDNLGV